MVKGGNMKKLMTTQCKPGGGTTIQIIYRKEELFKTSSFRTSERRFNVRLGGLCG